MVCGGADGNRTHDLFHAMEALSQLSYGPETAKRHVIAGSAVRETAGRNRRMNPCTDRPGRHSGCSPVRR